MRRYETTLRERYNELQRIIQACAKEDKLVEKEKLIAEMCIKWAVSRRYCLEKINALILTAKVKEFDDELSGKKILVWNG